jgi:hypothetical protein
VNWLIALGNWIIDPANVGAIFSSTVTVLCTITLSIVIGASLRSLGKRISRTSTSAPANVVPAAPSYQAPATPVAAPVAAPSAPPAQPAAAPLASATPTAAATPAPVAATPATAAMPTPPAPTVPNAVPPAVAPPASAQAFARASRLDNDPLNQ